MRSKCSKGYIYRKAESKSLCFAVILVVYREPSHGDGFVLLEGNVLLANRQSDARISEVGIRLIALYRVTVAVARGNDKRILRQTRSLIIRGNVHERWRNCAGKWAISSRLKARFTGNVDFSRVHELRPLYNFTHARGG